jgi:hypothetical protein
MVFSGEGENQNSGVFGAGKKEEWILGISQQGPLWHMRTGRAGWHSKNVPRSAWEPRRKALKSKL